MEKIDDILEETTEIVEETEAGELPETEVIDTDVAETADGTEIEELPEGETDFYGTVSGGDSIDYDALTTALAALSEDNQLLLAELEETQTSAAQSIMEKPLAEYTPTEGLLLILVVLAVGQTIFRIVGGIIKI